jgi:ligand-binding sensor domain-containing protein
MGLSCGSRLLGALLCTVFSAGAQNDTFYFRHFNVSNGLSHRNVSSIIQDSLGFMWYGTAEGLNRFDGYNFLPFKHDPRNPNSLVSDEITCLAPEKKGILWIGTRNKGLNRYNSFSGKYELFVHRVAEPNSISDNNITAVFCDTMHHLVWVGTADGLNAFDARSGTFRVFRNDIHSMANGSDLSLSHNFITAIRMDVHGTLWIGTRNGLNALDQKSGKFRRFVHDHAANSISSNQVRDLFIDKQNTVWIATDNGLNAYDAGKDHFRIFKHDDKDPYSLVSNDLSSVYQDKYGKIWVGTVKDGLTVFYPSIGKFLRYSSDQKGLNALSSNRINSVSQGRSGMFWAATSNGGLNAFNPKTLKFNLFSPFPKSEHDNVYDDITDMAVVKDNFLLITTATHGFYVYNIRQGSLRNFKPGGISGIGPVNNAACVLVDYLYAWLGIGDHLVKYDLLTNELHEVHYKPFSEAVAGATVRHGNAIVALYKDAAGELWIGTSDRGLYALNIQNGKCRHFSSELSNQHITSINEDPKQNIWVGTADGLNKISSGTGKVQVYRKKVGIVNSVSSNNINKVFCDRGGNLWITTNGGGINKYINDARGFKCFTTQDGLPGNFVDNIIEDHNGNFWIGSDHGICRLTFKDDILIQCRIFDLVDGLPTTEFCDTKLRYGYSGRMIFTSGKGFITFNPDSLRNNPFKPPVILSGFHLFNKLVEPNDSTGILKSSVSVTKEIHLQHDQNSFSFDFTAISFINADKNRYAYKLEGFDHDWNFRNAQNRSAHYTNIDPGHYVFRVKASNNDGVWNETGTSIGLVIAAPFWRTWWFTGVCLAFAVLLVYGIYYFRMMQVVKLQAVRNKISRDLHDQIGSTLSSISIYSEIARTMVSEKVPEAVPVLDGLGESARLSIESMSDIVWAINPVNDKFHNIVERLQLIASELLNSRNIQLEFNIPESLNDAKLSMQQRKNLYLLLKEAINNVAKYSEATMCTIQAERTDKKVNIVVNDNGVGFTGEERSLGGNGILFMKQRAVELNGSLQIFSEKQKGTNLVLEFKLV